MAKETQAPAPRTLEQLADATRSAAEAGNAKAAALALSSMAAQFRDKAIVPIEVALLALAQKDPVAAAQAVSTLLNQPVSSALEQRLVSGPAGIGVLVANDKVRENPAVTLEAARLLLIFAAPDTLSQTLALLTIAESAPQVASSNPRAAIESFRAAATLAPDSAAQLRGEAITAWKSLVEDLRTTDQSRAYRAARLAVDHAAAGSAFAATAAAVHEDIAAQYRAAWQPKP